MILTIFSYIFAFWIALIPIYLWGYGVSYLLDTPWNRRRFFLGMVGGTLSVMLIAGSAHMTDGLGYSMLLWYLLPVIILAIILSLVIARSSTVARGLIRYIISIDTVIILLILVGIFFVSHSLVGSFGMVASVAPLLIAAALEESTKHLMSVGLMSQDFRFSRREIIVFTLFVVLGFVWIENILYYVIGDISIGVWIWRSMLAMVAHLFAAFACAHIWWRALSYEPRSIRYVLIFGGGFFVATLIHLGYNAILSTGSLTGLLLYVGAAYVLFVTAIVGGDSVKK